MCVYLWISDSIETEIGYNLVLQLSGSFTQRSRKREREGWVQFNYSLAFGGSSVGGGSWINAIAFVGRKNCARLATWISAPVLQTSVRYIQGLFAHVHYLPWMHCNYLSSMTHLLNIVGVLKGNKLKPQDSFGEFDKFFLDLQKVQGIIRKHHQTFLQLFWMTYAILPSGKLSLYIYGKVFGGTPNIFTFWLFSENGSISERTVNRALLVHTTQ